MTALNNPPLIAAALVFLFFMLVFAGVYQYQQHRKSRSRLVEKIRSSRRPAGQEGERSPLESFEDSHSEEKDGSVTKLISSVGERFQPGNETEWKRRNMDLLRAGIRRPNALSMFWGVKWLLPLVLAGAFLFVKPLYMPQVPGTTTLLISLFLALVGFYAPDLWLKLKISERRQKIQEGIPDALDLMVVCVEAGMSLDAAIQRVAQEIQFQHKDLSDELVLTNLEVRAGKERRQALKNLALRTNIEDIRSLATLLIQTDQLGTSISQALRVYSDTFRTQRMQRAEEIAAKLPVKLIFPLGLFILPSMLVVLLAPALIQFFRAFSQVTN